MISKHQDDLLAIIHDATLLAGEARVTVTVVVAVIGEDTGLETRLANKKGLKSYKSRFYCWHCLHAVLQRYLRGERHGPGRLMSQTLGEKDGDGGSMASDDDGEYSEICYEDMIARPSSVLCDSDSDDKLSSGERAAKRRRIETIALDYLEGKPIFIMSASLRGPFENGWVNPWGKKRQSGVLDTHGEATIPETPDDERSLSPARDVFEHDNRSGHGLLEATPTKPFRDVEEVPETPTLVQRWFEDPANAMRPTRGRVISDRVCQLDPYRARLDVEWMDICSSTASEGRAGPWDAAFSVMEDVETPHNAPSGNLTTTVRTLPNSSSCDNELGLHSQSAVKNGLNGELHDRREVQQECAHASASLHVHPVLETLTGEAHSNAPSTFLTSSVRQDHDSNDASALHDTNSGHRNSQGTPPGNDPVPADTAPDEPFINTSAFDIEVNISGRPLHDILERTEPMNDQSPIESMLPARLHTEVTQAPTLAPTRQRSMSSSYAQDPDTNISTSSNRASTANNASEPPLLDQSREKAKMRGSEKARLRASSTMLNNKNNSLASLRRLQSGKQKGRQCSIVPPTRSPDRSGGEPKFTNRREHDLRGVKTVPSTRYPTPRLTRRAVLMIPTSVEPEDVDLRTTLRSVMPSSVESERSVMIEEDMIPNPQKFKNSVMNEDKNGQKGSPAKAITHKCLSRTAPRPFRTKVTTSPLVQQPAYSSPPLYPFRNVSDETRLQKKETTRIRRHLLENLPSSFTTDMFIPKGKGLGETLPFKRNVPREGQRQSNARGEDAHEKNSLRRVEQLPRNVIEDVEGESEIVTAFEDELQKQQARWQIMYARKRALKDKRCQDSERTDDGDLHGLTSSLVRSQRDIFNVSNDTPDSSNITNVAPTRSKNPPNSAHTSQLRSVIKADSAGENVSNNGSSLQMTSAQTGGKGSRQMSEARQDLERNRRTHTPRPQERPGNGLSPNSGVVPFQPSFHSARERYTQNKGGRIAGNVSAPQHDWPSNLANARVNDEETRSANHCSRRARRGRKRNRSESPANAPEALSIQPFKLATSQYTTKADSHAPVFSQDHLMGDEELNQAIRDAGSYLENGRFDLTKELREIGDDQIES